MLRDRANNMPAHSATPTENAIDIRLGDFASLTDALDYGAGGVGGMNFYSARGELLEVITWAQMRDDARVVAGRFIARGLQPGDRVAIVAETEADFSRALMGCLYARLVPCPVPLPSAFGSRVVYGEQLRRIADVAGITAAVAPQMFRDWIAESARWRSLIMRQRPCPQVARRTPKRSPICNFPPVRPVFQRASP
jgi:fatty-acyl-CoA synthase